jgi:hypothetical protein
MLLETFAALLPLSCFDALWRKLTDTQVQYVGVHCLREGGNGAWGDTHFKTWLRSSFDFHGECDLILLDAPSFEGGRGLKIHVRTQLSRQPQLLIQFWNCEVGCQPIKF